jgi:hypothetical protein
MKQGEIQTQLAATNRWWRNPRGWAADDPDLREAVDAPFVYEPAVLDSLTPGGLYVLRGPRRVGKSVEVKRAIQRLIAQGVAPRRIVHMSVDGWRAGNLGLLVDAASHFLLAADQPRFWFLDEITSITDGWPERIKWLRDNHPRFRTDTVVLTGSSAVGLTESTKALAGRRGPATDPDRVLLPMGFRAFTGLVGDGTSPPLDRTRVADLSASTLAGAANELAPWLHDLVGLWETYLQVGGFPRSVASYLTVRQPWRCVSGFGVVPDADHGVPQATGEGAGFTGEPRGDRPRDRHQRLDGLETHRQPPGSLRGLAGASGAWPAAEPEGAGKAVLHGPDLYAADRGGHP